VALFVNLKSKKKNYWTTNDWKYLYRHEIKNKAKWGQRKKKTRKEWKNFNVSSRRPLVSWL